MAWWRAALAVVLVPMSTPGMAATPQETYQAAQDAYDRGDWSLAASGFAQVLHPPGRDSRSDGIIRTRYAMALIRLSRLEDAEAAAKRAVSELSSAAPGARDAELASAYTALGVVQTRRLNMDAALAAYDKARAALPPGASSFEIDTGTIDAALVTHPDRAAAAADAALADSATFSVLPRPQQAILLALRARVELNRGHAREAVPFIKRALALTHGMSTMRIDLIDASVRGDAALIYTKLGDMDQARQYLAFSGAGYMPDFGWATNSAVQPPVCGEDIAPDDVAVVEFGVNQAGKVTAAQPVYASRPGPMGVAFARAALEWEWPADEVAKIEPFYRSLLRLELRCVTRPAPLALADAFKSATMAWLDSHGPQAAAALALAPLPVGTDPLGQFQLRLFDSSSRKAPSPADLDRALEANEAPADVRAYLGFGEITARAKSYANYNRALARDLEGLIARISSQPESGRPIAWLRTERGIARERQGDFDAAAEDFAAVTALPDRVLPARDPIRLIATLHRAILQRRAGEAAAADRLITTAGIDAAQCQLFDVRPTAVNASISSDAFPAMALAWRMNGSARESFDIAADGRVKNVRTVVAYPPFVFGEATQKAVSRFRYLPPTLNGAALGCSGSEQRVSFLVPR